ncbi:phosphate ABC transporter permease [Halosolutus gelatinilyticus]|uniref:phosphate ABC transporter permease n=1 Tax=Halosolutus gelatinilyticus TaxID=2931975 RepID=UPI001FF1D1F5|nr:phosphate ABC transporter permease [Halosolutus gelatinilyticus]
MDLGSIALVLGGVVLLFGGAALSVYGVVLLGALLGGSGGYLAGPTVAAAIGFEGIVAVAGSIVLGAVAGGVLGYVLLSAAVAAMSFVVGTFLGLTTLAPVLVDGPWYVEAGAAIALGLVAAVLGALLTKRMMGLLTAFVGAAFASRSITIDHFVAAREAFHPEPLLFDVTAPAFLALVALGICSQVGLFKFGYVTRIARLLPGSKAIPGRRRRDDSKPT